jgi:oxygen-independent coproporphyrinogen-3 oxidase
LKFLRSKKAKPAINSVYVHIPFCRSKCYYCDFYSLAGADEKIDKYLEALLRELDFWSELLDFSSVETIYFGGGTPTLLSSSKLNDLFEIVFSVLKGSFIEVTLEANPESLSEEKLSLFRKRGVTRVSVGIQSFDSKILNFLGRLHSAEQAFKAAELVKEHGFNLSLDFIYGIPGEPFSSWKKTLLKAAELQPDSISCYAFSFRGKKFRGRSLKSDDDYFEEYIWTVNCLKTHGYRHYEISNWALPGKECRHNLNYWLRKNYLGLGPAAASLIDDLRFSYEPELNNFLAESPHFYFEKLLPEQIQMEEIYLGLRTNLGIKLAQIPPRSLKKLEGLIKEKLLEIEGDCLRATDRGMFVLDRLVLELLE